MNKKLLVFIISLLLNNLAKAQWNIYDGQPHDSIEITFDSLQITDFVTDSSGLWQIGNTTKSFFALGGIPVLSIMTDTTNSYPINASAWFEIKFNNWSMTNTIVDFKHKYQTDSFHDGCIVEFSTDAGATWENVKGDCNIDNSGNFNGTLTHNLYSISDTLTTGEMAFSGTSNGWIYSRIQFFWGFPIKSTDSTSWCNMEADTIHLRFRFVSDSTTDTLDGWIIDSIKIENDIYWGAVAERSKIQQLLVHPNPSYDGIIYFPELENEKLYKMEIINNLGQTVYRNTYQHEINLDNYTKGLYFYRVIGDTYQYSGQLLLE